jgi:hypothetical protein
MSPIRQRRCKRWHSERRDRKGQDALDHRRIDDGSDDLELAATVRAMLQMEVEDALERQA